MGRSKYVHERSEALKGLYNNFTLLPDKNQAWEDLHRLSQDKDYIIQWCAAEVIGATFMYLPDKDQAWSDLVRLTLSEYSEVRGSAVNAIGVAFPNIPDKDQAQSDLHRFTRDGARIVRWHTAKAIGVAFSNLPNRTQAWSDLLHLTLDRTGVVRAASYHSLGKISILKATSAEEEKEFKNELEEAIRYFEKSSHEIISYRPAKFCLPFYRSFYMIAFRKDEIDIQRYIAEAKSAVEGSESREKLLEAIKNLGNALKEAQKVEDTDFDLKKSNLNAYMLYCEHAVELLDAVEEKTPGAARLVRKGLPIIDEMIKEIITEIRGRAKEIYERTKDTPLKEFGQKTCMQTQDLSLQNPLDLEIGLGRIINTAKEWCEYIKHDTLKKSACEKLKSLEGKEIKEKIMIFSEVFEYISQNLNIPRIQTVHFCGSKKETVRVAVIQFCYKLTNSYPFVIENKDEVKAKIFSGLNIAERERANIVCLPELCLIEEWILDMEKNYSNMIIVGGSFYKDNKNICPIIAKSNTEIPSQSKITPSAQEDPEMWENGMILGDRIYKYETQFGKFVVLICRDFERFAHYFRESDVDFIFCPAFNDANDRFHIEANNQVTKTPSYILIANTGIHGGSSIFAQMNKSHFNRLVSEGCKDEGDISFKLCEAKKGKNEIIIADFNLNHKSIQIPTPSESSQEKRSVTHIRKLPIL